jgi:ABC-2 type transport system permease protein
MWAIVRKELNSFFSSYIGLGLMLSFYVLMGLYTWFFQGNTLEYGFAELSVFFDLSPWFFLFFIPAICMRLFAEEFEFKTFQLLRGLPIRLEGILFGKWLSMGIVLICLLVPTWLFVYSVGQLGSPLNNFDLALVIGGYLALFLVALSFVSLCALASSLTNKQTLAFVLGLVFNFICWQGPQELASFLGLDWQFNSLYYYYQNMSRGVLPLNGLVYFFGFNGLVLGLIWLRLRRVSS